MSLLGADVSSGEPLGDEADLLLLKSADKMIVIIEIKMLIDKITCIIYPQHYQEDNKSIKKLI